MGSSFRASFRAFGCRLNQSETEALAAAFAEAGFRVVPHGQQAEVIVFSTCTVTGKAEQKARRELRAAARDCPEALILVTGCYAELEPEALEALSPRAVAVPGSRKSSIGPMAQSLREALEHGLDPAAEGRSLAREVAGLPGQPFAFKPGDYSSRSRAGLKVQDGCNNRCAYCRVCLARGPSVSLEPALALERARRLEADGFPEIVLTGVNLSQYRHGDADFPALVKLLVAGTEAVAFRISSYEPDRVNDAFLDMFGHPRVRPHLHLAAQSGSDRILRAMRRGYGRSAILDAVMGARKVKGDPFIGMDLIAGFPGEDDSDFHDSMELIASAQPAGLHAFPFSPRPGTAAFSMSPRVPERVAGQRVAAMTERAAAFRAAFASRRIGQELEVVLERHSGDGDEETAPGSVARLDPAMGVSADYLNVALEGVPQGCPSRIFCLVTKAADTVRGADLVARYHSGA